MSANLSPPQPFGAVLGLNTSQVTLLGASRNASWSTQRDMVAHALQPFCCHQSIEFGWRADDTKDGSQARRCFGVLREACRKLVGAKADQRAMELAEQR